MYKNEVVYTNFIIIQMKDCWEVSYTVEVYGIDGRLTTIEANRKQFEFFADVSEFVEGSL